jgi:hypothetical protein
MTTIPDAGDPCCCPVAGTEWGGHPDDEEDT